MDRLVNELYDLKGHTRELEKVLQESKATARTKEKEKEEAFRAELERQEKAHQQAIAELTAETTKLTAERDLAREQLLKQSGCGSRGENRPAGAEHRGTRQCPRKGSDGYLGKGYEDPSLPRARVQP